MTSAIMKDVKILHEVLIPSAKITIREDDIVVFDLSEDQKISVQDVKDMTDVIGKWGKGKKYYNLILMPDLGNIPFDVRQYTASEERSRYSKADAFVISSIAMQVIGNFYLQFHKPFLPTRIFNDEQAALDWLSLLRDQQS